MKKSYLISAAVLLLLSLGAYAQPIYKLPTGWRQAVYYHGNYYQSPPDSPVPIQYVGDTVLCGKTYCKINELSFFWSADTSTRYVRIDSGKYFELRHVGSCKEVLLYDFSLNEQDTFFPFRLNGDYVDDWIFSDYYIVDSISTITLPDSSQRKWMRLKSNGYYRQYAYWVEGIGDIEMGFFASGDFEGGRTSLICHKEEQELIWETLENRDIADCNSLIGILEPNGGGCTINYSKQSNSKQYNIWYFGQNAGLDFNGDTPVALTNSAMFVEHGCASISDANGNLLFYTDGKTIWDKNHVPMPNGTGLTGQAFSTQSVMIVPQPGNDLVYYVFITNESWNSNNFCYSIVNMRLNGGTGDVEYTKKNSLILANVTNKLTATYHANCKDIWIIVHGLGNANFYAYLLTSTGLELSPVVSSTGIVNNNNFDNMQLKVSPNGEKLANCISNIGRVQLFDFDTQTGTINNPITINFHSRLRPTSCEFSPNSEKFYIYCLDPKISNPVFQYDITSNDSLVIAESREMISYKGGGFLQLATNGKIYVSNPYNESYIGVINSPNASGTSSNYIEKAIYLAGKKSYTSLPNILITKPCVEQIDFTVNIGCQNKNSFFNFIGTYCVDSLKWNLGNGTCSEVQLTDSFHYIYSFSGDYITKMIYWRNGVSDTIEKSIEIPQSYIDTQIFKIFQGDTLFVGGKYYTTSGNYSDTFQSVSGCDSVVFTNLTVCNIDSSIQYFEICRGDSIHIGSNSYYETGTYIDTLISSFGCDSIVTTNLTIITPIVTLNTYNECEGFSVIVGANTYSASGVYKDVVNDCDTIITDLTINPLPIFSFLKTDDNCKDGIGRVAVANVSGTPPFSYNWNTGSTDSVITDLGAGYYVVSVIDSNSCTKADTAEVLNFDIDCEFYLYVPNAFSPNRDGLHDVFKVVTHSLSHFDMQIYNRWGEMIFRSDNPNVGWDGTFGGVDCKQDIYTIVIHYGGKAGTVLQHKSTLHLLR
ncbi:MAG: gliding motility-associated C-terminal domain-containing protein [Bacteroidia bacterium]|nr:gliding motility-associated C-terminal domain-containing protein [Bacteroidia bacterium]